MREAVRSASKALGRFARAREGLAALEFALVAMPFFLLTIGLAEIGMIGFVQANLNYAVSDAAREIRTGQVQTEGVSYSDVRQALCDRITSIMSVGCEGNLFLDVARFDSFVDAQAANPLQNGQFSDEGFGFQPGDPSDIVVVRAFYRWKVLTPLFESVLGNSNGGERIMASTMMFRNEPFPDPTPND